MVELILICKDVWLSQLSILVECQLPKGTEFSRTMRTFSFSVPQVSMLEKLGCSGFQSIGGFPVSVLRILPFWLKRLKLCILIMSWHLLFQIGPNKGLLEY